VAILGLQSSTRFIPFQALCGQPIFILEQAQHSVVRELHAFSQKWDRRPLQARLSHVLETLALAPSFQAEE
jgi:hypothetical protein